MRSDKRREILNWLSCLSLLQNRDQLLISRKKNQYARKLKSPDQKNLVKSNKSISRNCIFGSFKLFPSSKIDFRPFLKSQKMDFGPKIFFRKIDLFDFTNFLAWTYLNFLAHCAPGTRSKI